jgi:hypothetical protein
MWEITLSSPPPPHQVDLTFATPLINQHWYTVIIFHLWWCVFFFSFAVTVVSGILKWPIWPPMNIRVTTYSLVQATAGICLKKGEKRESLFFHLFFSEGQENLSFCFFFLVLSFRKISHKTIVWCFVL